MLACESEPADRIANADDLPEGQFCACVRTAHKGREMDSWIISVSEVAAEQVKVESGQSCGSEVEDEENEHPNVQHLFGRYSGSETRLRERRRLGRVAIRASFSATVYIYVKDSIRFRLYAKKL